jgi:fimbrial isopeptide formation D2 family protein/uncharacterized repeat protein (TIGR01451 family)
VVLAALAVAMVATDVASAAPALSVSKAIASKPLLGGTATYTVTVRNTGADKGYNLSLSDVLSSSRPNPQGRVTFVSASDSSGTQYPTSVATDPVTGDTTIRFTNIRDLASTETYSLTFTVDLSGDPSWRINDDLNDTVTATVAQFPDGSGTTYTGSTSRSDPVLPIKLVAKTVEQSTGVEQATGTEDRVFHYMLQVRNNYLYTTNAAVLTDALPDGLEYLGVTSGPAPDTVARDPLTGVTTLTWNLGDMIATQVQNIRYAAGIRYDYYGTAHGGTNRPTKDFSGTPAPGAPIPDKTTFTNQADLAATYQGTPVSDAASASVTGAYLTIAKSGTPASGGNGTVVSYVLTYSTSQYYTIADQTPGSMTVTDTLPNGQTYNGDASPMPTSWVANPLDGTTTITWDGGALAALGHGTSATITFTATVDNDWRGPVIGGLPIIAGDALTNLCNISGVWDDQIDTARADATSTSSAAAHFSTSLPLVNKQVEDPPGSDTWVQTTTRTVGDTVTFRVRFNTTDGSTPTSTDIKMGRITVTDWLPPGMTYDGDAVITPSNPGDFTDPDSGSPPALLNVGVPPTVVTLGGLQGLQWYLGNVAQAGWWQAVFTAHIDDVPAVADGVNVNNLWKLTGIDTSGNKYSARDAAAVDYTAPFLTLTKTATTVPTPLLPGSNVTYTTTIANSGHAAAKDVLVTDTLPVGMRLAAPAMVSASLDGTPLSAGTGYVLSPAYDSATGVFSVDLENGTVHTAIPAGSTLTLVYRDRVDAAGGIAGKALTNIATVGYDTQADGSGRATPGTSNVADPNTDDATVTLANLGISKTVSPLTATPVTIGDVLTYTLHVTVPAGEIAYWPRLLDVVNRDGVAWDPALTPALAQVSGSPLAAAAFQGGVTAPTVSTAGLNSTTFTWNLTDPLDNRGQATDYVFTLTFRVLVNGLEDNASWEFWLPAANDQIGDRGRVDWNTADPAARPANTDKNVQSAQVQSNVDQPLLALDKQVLSSGPYAGGSPVTYETTITNNGWSTAYDITWQDTLPAGLELPQLISATRAGTPLVAGTDFTSDFSGNPQTIDFNGGTSHTSLAPGASLVVRYSAQVRNDVGSGATLTNSADVDWASKDGAPAGSRVYDDGPRENGYAADTDAASVMTRQAALTKSVTPTTARIGETLTYTIRVTVPAETVAIGPDLSDAIATDGMSYVPGSATVTDVNGDPQTHAVLSGVSEDTSASPGSTIDFQFQSPIDNADPSHPLGDTDYVFDLTFQVQVTGRDDVGAWLWDPGAGPVTSADTATFSWSDGASPHSSQASAGETIGQPVLAVTKTFSDHAPSSAISPIDSTVTITNTGWATAYEDDGGYDFVDQPPSCFLAATDVTVTHSVNGALTPGVDYTVSHAGTTLRIEYTSSRADLAPGESLTITYRNAFVQPPDPSAPAAGGTYTNAAATQYSSMPDSVAGERTYGATASDSLTVGGVGISKTSDAPGGLATIGQAYDYSVALHVPAGTTLYGATVTDTVPDGLTVTGTSANLGTVASTPNADGTNTVLWTLPDGWQQGTPAVTPTLSIAVRVDDTYIDGTPVSGLQQPLGSGQDILHNRATLDYLDGPSGAHHQASDSADVTVVEPHLTIAKQADPATAGPGDAVAYTIDLGNDGASPAHSLVISDQVPAELFTTGASPVIGSMLLDGVPLTAGVDYSAALSANPIAITFASSVTLAPGSSLEVVLVAHVRGGVAGGLTPTNTASATWSSTGDAGGRQYGPISDDAVITTLAPALAIAKTVVGDSTVNRYDDVTFSLVVTNTGDAPADHVTVSDDLPGDGFTYVAGSTQASWPDGSSSADPSVAGSHLSWDLGATLAPQASLTLTFRMHVGMVALTQYTNAASATVLDGGGSALTPPSDTALFTVAKPETTSPAVSITKSLAKGQPAVVGLGEPVVYAVVVTNTGDTTLLTVPLHDTYDPTALHFVSAAPAPTDTAPSGTLDWSDLTGVGGLAPGASSTVQLTFTAGRYDGEVVNTAAVLGAVDEYGDPAPDAQAAATVRIKLKTKLTVLKTGKDISGWPPVPGHVVNWKIVVGNAGQATLTNVVVTDTVAKWQRYQRGSIRGHGSDDSGAPHLRWTIASLAPSKTVVLSFHAVIVKGTPHGATIANQARADSDQTGPVVSDDPFTTKANDATVLNPRGASYWWLLWAALAAAVAAAVTVWSHRHRPVAHVQPSR